MSSIGDQGDDYIGIGAPSNPQQPPASPYEVMAESAGGGADVGGDGGNFSDANAEAPYRFFKSWTRYVWKQGVMQLPIASPQGFGGNACAIVQVNAPYGAKLFHWQVQREGAPPAIPNPILKDQNQVFTAFDITEHSPDRTVDGASRVYAAEGVFVYAFKNPVWITDGKICFGGNPVDGTSPEPVSPGDVTDGLQS